MDDSSSGAQPSFHSNWQDHDTASLSPSLLPLPDKLPRAWERTSRSPLARQSRVRKVWRRYSLRSRAGLADDSRSATPEPVKSPEKVVKRLRVNLLVEEESHGVNGERPASRITRCDRRKSGLPHKPKRTTHDDFNHATAEPGSPIQIKSRRQSGVSRDSPRRIQDETELSRGHSSHTPRRVTRRSTAMDQEASEDGSEDGSAQKGRAYTLRNTILSPVRKSPVKRRVKPSRTHRGAPRYSLPVLPAAEFLGAESPAKPAAWLNVETKSNSGVLRAHGLDVVQEEQEPDRDDQARGELPSEVQDTPQTSAEAVGVHEEASRENSSVPSDNELAIKTETSETKVAPTTASIASEGQESGIESPLTVDVQVETADMEAYSAGTEDNAPQGPVSDTLEALVEEEMNDAAVHTFSESADTPLETEGVLPDESSAATSSAAEEDTQLTPEISQEPEHTVTTEANPEVSHDQLIIAAEDPSSRTLPLDEAISLIMEATARTEELQEAPREPPIEDTYAHLDADTAHLKDFLNRAALSKARRASSAVSIARRTSLQNRRDSDAVRQALASPRRVLDDKDPNSPSLTKTYELNAGSGLESNAGDLSAGADDDEEVTTTLNIPADLCGTLSAAGQTPAKPSRRSARTPKCRIPAPQQSQLPQPTPAAAATPNKIPVRRADGSEPVVLKKTEAQELANLTRANTRRNKGGAVPAPVRLVKLSAEVIAVETVVAAEIVREIREGQRAVRWDEQLVYFQNGNVQPPDLDNAVAEIKQAVEETEKKKQAPKMRRLRGLGAANGTPGKGLLAPSNLLPAEVVAEKHVKDALSEEKQKESKEKKSRLATPRKLKLPTPVSSLGAVGEGKENMVSSKLATPKKIPLAAKATSTDKEGGLGLASAKKRIRAEV